MKETISSSAYEYPSQSLTHYGNFAAKPLHGARTSSEKLCLECYCLI